ncbi:PREDICTED: dynein heavy chain 7, axonemal-like [Polistes canadensis]|uniref:dynein heavy chain 7, axonemal-like n=1 Tax=Polistes canadensis TaxID=91411 RepID=UPI0007190688|nr:PREDICTED: dynein heavy chain 7, axonemal-like [Polistes canadensis]
MRLEDMLRPIMNDLNIIVNQFGIICDGTNVKDKIRLLISQKLDFDVYLGEIKKYNMYHDIAKSMVKNVYYDVGQLNQEPAKEALIEYSSEIIDMLTKELVNYHLTYNQLICSEFENLKMKALNVPKDAKRLTKLIDYMMHDSKVLVKELEERIHKSVEMLSVLLEITTLTYKHMKINGDTILWLNLIQPIFAQSNIMCEAIKNDFEDDLQKRISTLNVQVDDLFPYLVILDNMDDIRKVQEYSEHYDDLIKKVKEIEDQVITINAEESFFKFPETEFPRVIELKEIVYPFYSLVNIIRQWQRDNSIWLNGPFEYLNPDVIKEKTLDYLTKIMEMNKQFKSRIKMDVTSNKSFKFSGITDDPDPMQQPAPLKLSWQAINDIQQFKIYLPLVICICNPALKQQHWKEMSIISQFDLTPHAGTTLQKIINFNLIENIEKYEIISTKATKELCLHQQLAEMQQMWYRISFEIIYSNETKLFVFKNQDDIESLLEDHFLKIEEMRASHFIESISTSLKDFHISLKKIQEIIILWFDIQKYKISISSIFYCQATENYLSQETSLYRDVNKILENIKKKISENPNFHTFQNDYDILNDLQDSNIKMDQIMKRVQNYIDNKRLDFERFFFLSDIEIQNILFELDDINKLQLCLQKCFPGINKLQFDKTNCDIYSILGDCNETLQLNTNITILSGDEKWLSTLQKVLKNTIYENLQQCYLHFEEKDLCDWITNVPSMVIICISRIYWTSLVQSCYSPFNLLLLKTINKKYSELLASLADRMKSNIMHEEKKLLMSLIIITANHEEIIRLLLEKNICSSSDFNWLVQMRYYWIENEIKISLYNTTINYGYEYNYYEQYLVNTPLTDRCLRTLMEAYNYHLFGAIIGSVATGKMETIKYLINSLAMPYYILNTNERFTYKSILNVLKGLISCGTWVCLKNLDKLELTVLSAVTQTIVNIHQVISTNLKSVMFEGTKLNLNPNGNICIIMNVQCNKYYELPDNLKILFRSISMVKPDLKQIIEIELLASGFSNGKELATKLVLIYKLLCDQLLDRPHYKFDLSSVKTVIKTARMLKIHFQTEDENILLLRSVIDVILPTFSSQDIIIFQNIIHSIFPYIKLPSMNYNKILMALENACESRSLDFHEILKLKSLQMFELMHVQHALILVGGPLTGKTEMLHVLADTFTLLHKWKDDNGANITLEIINPGIINSNQLFGQYKKELNLWEDGLCTKIFRTFAANNSSDKKWLIFDGSLSDIWVENLYTVIDSNKFLHLISGERISMTQTMSVIFETMDLSNVSPVIISHCGIIYIESQSIGWKPYILSHIKQNQMYNKYEKIMYSLLSWSLDACLQFVRLNCLMTITVGELHLVRSTLSLFEIYLTEACNEQLERNENVDHFVIWSQAALMLSLVWVVGGNSSTDFQVKFNEFCLALWNNSHSEYPCPEDIKHYDITLPTEGLIQDNLYIFKGVGNWKHYNDLLKTETITDMCNFDQKYVPTLNSIKYGRLFLTHIKYRKAFIICSNGTTGKTVLLQNLLKYKLSKHKYLTNTFNYSSLVTAEKAKNLFLSYLSRIKKRCYGLPEDKCCINLIDDFNLNTDTNINSSSVLELIRQYFNNGYWYDTKIFDKIFVTNISFLLTITTGYKKHNICPRFMRHFNVYTFPELTMDNIYKIFSNMLLTNLKNNLFSTDVLNYVTSITNATIDVYNSILNVLRPIPTKVQYLFNIRDIYKVISGCSLIQKESVDTKIVFLRLWVHETLRVFGDRISHNDDKEILYQSIKEAVKKYFKDSFESAFDHLPKFEDNKITKDSFKYLLFGNFIELDETSLKYKKYEEINSLEILKDAIVSYMNNYNNINNEKIDIVITQQMLIYLVEICRILAMPSGNAIIISTIRSGKKSITKLAAYIQEQNFFEPTMDSYYNFNIWKDDLKKILRTCGESQQNCTFYLTERQMKNTFLQDVNSLLNTGEIPDLFSTEEKLSIIATMRIHAQKGDSNAEINISAVMDYFIEQCKNNLHFVLGFSPINNTMRKYFYLYPNLIKYCTINYYDTWPEDALVEIAKIHIEIIDIPGNIKDSVIKACIQFHNDAKINSLMYLKDNGIPTYVTNSAFLHTTKLYKHLMTKKQEQIITTRNRYMMGLEQLEIAAQQVEKMSTTLTILKPELELSAQRTIKTMKEVKHENLTVEKATILIKKEEGIANKKAEIAGALKSECEADLAVAIPILEDAVVALNTLKPTDITLVKAMKNPPDTVKLVMAAVCVMLGVTPDRTVDSVSGKKITDYWGPSKRILGDMNFLQNLKDYNKDNIPSAVIQIIKNVYMTDKNFVPHIVAKASSAAEGLCKWVRAMVSYNEIAKVVAPKKEKLAAAQKECDEAEAFLNEKRQTLSNLNIKLATLNSNLQDTLQKKLQLEEEVSNCTIKLQKAERLIASLGSEKERWLQLADNLQLNYDNLAGDMILSSGIIAYMAPYNIKCRDKMIKKWINLIQMLNLPYSKSYDFVNILGVELEISSWYLSGLSKNRFSTENAIIMENSKLWPLFIDSQNQANNWIKEIEKKNGLKVVKFTDSDYMSIIRYNIEHGNPILLENIGEELEVAIDSVLLKNIYKIGDDWYLKIGRIITKYSLNFRLYVTTRLSNPHYLPHVYSKLIVIDFSLPCEALQDKLLNIIIRKEKLELQEQFENIWIQDTINKEALKLQEDKILSTLSSTSTNIIEDEKAIMILDSSKTLSLNIIKKQEQAEIMKNEINIVRSTYTQYTKFCAGLFTTLNALSNLDHMYRFSFSWFIQLFTRSIQGSNKNISLEKRLKLLKYSFTQNLHSSVCRSLFERHKLVYSFLLCSKILLDNKQATEKEIHFFSLIDIEYFNISNVFQAPIWLPMKIWNKICYINDNLPNFHGLAQDISSNDVSWKIYWNSDLVETLTLPDPWDKKLGPYQKLILAKIAKPDKIIYYIIYFVENYLGKMFNYSSQYIMSQSYAESSCLRPLLFILPSYSSPLSFLSAYASTIGYSSKYISLSMEDTQQKKAEVLIKKAQEDGGWVFLQNCHLAVPWLFQLEKICENLNASNTSLTFRLWLSSYSINEFPISILQNCVKITLDDTNNIKKNLLRSFQLKFIKNKDIFDCCPGKEKIFIKFLYQLCFFHIVVKEKNNFGMQAWNIPYDFDYSDFETSILLLQDLINNHENVSIEAISYFIGECNYGGKIMNKFDQRCLNHLLSYYCDDNITNNSQHFFSNNLKYLLPRKCEYNEIMKHIKNMSINHPSKIFGSDENALAIRDAKETNEFLTYMSLMNSIISSKINESTEVDELIIIDNIESEISNISIIENVENIYHSTFSNPLNIVLIYEIELINKTLIEIKGTLKDLRSAFNGDIILNNYLEELWKLIYNCQIPYIWKKVSNNMEVVNLSEFINYLINKRKLIKDWIENEHPYLINFGALTYCKMFLSISKLMFSQKHNLSIENIYIDFEILTIYEPSEIKDKFNDQYYIYGLYLIGAQWDSQEKILINSIPGIYRYNMPIMCLKFITQEAILENIYKCPVYTICIENNINKLNTNLTRSKQLQRLHMHLMTVPLKTNICVAHWIRCGTALYH